MKTSAGAPRQALNSSLNLKSRHLRTKTIWIKAVLIGFLTIGGVVLAVAQHNNPVYLNDSFEPVDQKDGAAYYRTILRTGKGFEVHIYYATGTPQMHGIYLDPELTIADGAFKFFYDNGQKESEGYFCRNTKCGIWKRWTAEGTRKSDRVYPDPAEIYAPKTKDEPAQFPGGYRNLLRYVSENAQYPVEALQKGISGSVKVAFRIDQGGLVRDVEVSEGAHYFLDRAALECVWQMPLWQAASRNGKKIESQFILPLLFEIKAGEGHVRIGG